MKRTPVLVSAERLSVTHLLILVLFLVSFTDVVKGASLAPTSSLSTSGTPSMSLSISTSVSQTNSGSASGSLSITGTVSAAVTNSVTQLFSFTASLSFGASQSPSTSFSATIGTSNTGTFSAAITQGPPPIFYGNQAFPAGTPFSVIQDFFCGNGYEDLILGEQCDYGPGDIPRFSCCTPSCQYANGGKICRPRGETCYKKGRCGSKGFCRGTRPKRAGKGCTLGGAKGKCNGKGTCVLLARRAVSGRALRFLRTGGKKIKKLLKKRNLKIRQKHQNFNLDEIETETKSNKKFNNNQNIVDEIFDEDEISDAELDENNEEDSDSDQDEDEDEDEDEEQEDLDEQEFDQDTGLALFPEEEN